MDAHGLERSDADPMVSESPWLSDVVEHAWRKLGGKVPREHIRAVAAEAAIGFAHARVGTFLPILVERKVRDALNPYAKDPPSEPPAARIAETPTPQPIPQTQ